MENPAIAIHQAIARNDAVSLRRLLEQCSPSQWEEALLDGKTCWSRVLLDKKRDRLFPFLLGAGLDASKPVKIKKAWRSPLSVAIQYGRWSVMEQLLEYPLRLAGSREPGWRSRNLMDQLWKALQACASDPVDSFSGDGPAPGESPEPLAPPGAGVVMNARRLEILKKALAAGALPDGETFDQWLQGFISSSLSASWMGVFGEVWSRGIRPVSKEGSFPLKGVLKYSLAQEPGEQVTLGWVSHLLAGSPPSTRWVAAFLKGVGHGVVPQRFDEVVEVIQQARPSGLPFEETDWAPEVQEEVRLAWHGRRVRSPELTMGVLGWLLSNRFPVKGLLAGKTSILAAATWGWPAEDVLKVFRLCMANGLDLKDRLPEQNCTLEEHLRSKPRPFWDVHGDLLLRENAAHRARRLGERLCELPSEASFGNKRSRL